MLRAVCYRTPSDSSSVTPRLLICSGEVPPVLPNDPSTDGTGVNAGLSANRSPVARQPGYFVGKREIGAEVTLGRATPLDLFSTEDHGHHLQSEAVR